MICDYYPSTTSLIIKKTIEIDHEYNLQHFRQEIYSLYFLKPRYPIILRFKLISDLIKKIP